MGVLCSGLCTVIDPPERKKTLILCCVSQESPVFTELKRENEEEKGGWVKFGMLVISLLAPC